MSVYTYTSDEYTTARLTELAQAVTDLVDGRGEPEHDRGRTIACTLKALARGEHTDPIVNHETARAQWADVVQAQVDRETALRAAIAAITAANSAFGIVTYQGVDYMAHPASVGVHLVDGEDTGPYHTIVLTADAFAVGVLHGVFTLTQTTIAIDEELATIAPAVQS